MNNVLVGCAECIAEKVKQGFDTKTAVQTSQHVREQCRIVGHRWLCGRHTPKEA